MFFTAASYIAQNPARRMSKILPLSSIVVSFLLFTATSAVPQVLLFRTFTSNDGLVSNYITALLQDSQGYLWIGTDEGMSRYDGISFKNLTPREGLSFSRVNCIAESHSSPGSIWIGTNGGGVSLLRGETFVPYRIGSADSSNQIGSILEDSSGIVWCGTSDGVVLIRDGTVSRFAAGEIGGFVTSLARAGSGKVWVGGRELHLCSATGGSSKASEEIAKLKKSGQDASAAMAQTKDLRERISELEKTSSDLDVPRAWKSSTG